MKLSELPRIVKWFIHKIIHAKLYPPDKHKSNRVDASRAVRNRSTRNRIPPGGVIAFGGRGKKHKEKEK